MEVFSAGKKIRKNNDPMTEQTPYGLEQKRETWLD